MAPIWSRHVRALAIRAQALHLVPWSGSSPGPWSGWQSWVLPRLVTLTRDPDSSTWSVVNALTCCAAVSAWMPAVLTLTRSSVSIAWSWLADGDRHLASGECCDLLGRQGLDVMNSWALPIERPSVAPDPASRWQCDLRQMLMAPSCLPQSRCLHLVRTQGGDAARGGFA